MISVIVPFYYGNKYINELIEMINLSAMVLHSKYKDILVEVIIVNDSLETEVEISKKIEQGDIFIKIINNEKNMGIHYSRVNGLKHAKGEFIIFLDQDDEIDEKLLLSQREMIKQNDIVVCSGKVKFPNKEKKFYIDSITQKCVKDINKYLTVRNQIISPGQCMIKRSAIPSVWCENILKTNCADDYFLWLIMLVQNKKFEINEDELFFHIVNGDNKSLDVKNMENSIDEMIEYLNKIKCLTKRQIRTLYRCNKYRKKFRHSSKLMKVICSLKYYDLAIINLHYYFVYDRRQR